MANRGRDTVKAQEKATSDLLQLKGISQKRADCLNRLGLYKKKDILFYYPRNYEDWSQAVTPSSLTQPGVYTFQARVSGTPQMGRKGKLSWVKTNLTDGGATIHGVWFNEPWMKTKLIPGESFLFHGTIRLERGRWEATNLQVSTAVLPAPSEKVLDWTASEEPIITEKGMVPIYPLCKGLTQKILRDCAKQVLESDCLRSIQDPIPPFIRENHHLSELDFSLRSIHFPSSQADYHLARHRLSFEELFLIRAALDRLKTARLAQATAPALESNQQVEQGLKQILQNLPFQLTHSQIEAVNDIFRDLRQPVPMNRLLQGDVGSGKTLVAALAMAYVHWCAGGQTVLMAPTSVLVQQHQKTLRDIFQNTDIRVESLTGQRTARERKQIVEQCLTGEITVLVGTQALITKEIPFKNLILTVTDEQHRFGVRQRSKLGGLPDNPETSLHHLVMSATPIPRTLALILYGDLDLSVMREMPKGRQKVETQVVDFRQWDHIRHQIRETVEQGEQVYVVCPTIEESESQPDCQSAQEVYEQLAGHWFPELRVGLLHGRLNGDEKDEVMTSFLNRETQVLVTTTVVEVGVDNPNATLMVILNAERFGLAQLHQLRGRVGRGEAPSICLLVSNAKQGDSLDRLQQMTRFHSGFDLAEEDLKTRGPGDFFGTKQHGLPQFKLVNLYSDLELIQEVEQSLEEIHRWSQNLTPSQRRSFYDGLDRALEERYPESGIHWTL